MTKFIATFLITLALTATVASAKTANVRLAAYVPEVISIQIVDEQIIASSNNADTQLLFTDSLGHTTNANEASIINVFAA